MRVELTARLEGAAAGAAYRVAGGPGAGAHPPALIDHVLEKGTEVGASFFVLVPDRRLASPVRAVPRRPPGPVAPDRAGGGQAEQAGGGARRWRWRPRSTKRLRRPERERHALAGARAAAAASGCGRVLEQLAGRDAPAAHRPVGRAGGWVDRRRAGAVLGGRGGGGPDWAGACFAPRRQGRSQWPSRALCWGIGSIISRHGRLHIL